MADFQYTTSTDYIRLIELMKEQHVICIVDRGECWEDLWRISIGKTIYEEDSNNMPYRIIGASSCILSAWDDSEFIKECEKHNVKFIDPTYTSELAEAIYTAIEILADSYDYEPLKNFCTSDCQAINVLQDALGENYFQELLKKAEGGE
jgi:hypothetical protein